MSWENWAGRAAGDQDPELEQLFPDQPDLREVAGQLHRVPRPEAPLNPNFRLALRRKLMQEAWEQSHQPEPWWRRLAAPRRMALAGAAVGTLLIGLVTYSLLATPTKPPSQVVVSSPLQGSHQVAATQPISLQFSQPMDTASVQESIQIEPATKVRTFQWTNGDSRLQIVPENGLAPNTQYKVQIGPQAKAKGGEPMPRPAAVSFVTAPTTPPTPTPRPSATPSPTAPAIGITAPRLIGPSGPALPAWSADGTALYVIDGTGALKKYSLSGGSTQIASGVSLVEVAPDGQVAYAANGSIVDGSITVSAAQPQALGFQNGRLVALSGHQIESLVGTVLNALTGGPALTEDATAADFSPGGGRLAYLGASGLHILDLTSGQDSIVGAASGLGSWSSDGSRYAYPTANGVSVTGGGAISVPGGATSVSWSSGNQLLITTTSKLWLANADGSQLRQLASGSFSHATWSPANDQSFWFKRGGSVYVSSVTAVAGAQGASASTPNAQLVSQFMTARQGQGGGDPSTFLDANGKRAFSGLTLNYDSQMRWNLLLDQPGRAVVRIIPGAGAPPLDETLTVVDSGSGGLIDDVTERPDSLSTGPNAGPNVLKVTVSSTQVSITFDSDLNPATVDGGVTIAGVSSQATYDARSRTVVLTPEGGLDSGTSYQLEVTDGLRDVNGTPAAGFTLPFNGVS